MAEKVLVVDVGGTHLKILATGYQTRLPRSAASRPRTAKWLQRCSNLSDLSNMHLICTSQMLRERS
jgi:hypothetical protein